MIIVIVAIIVIIWKIATSLVAINLVDSTERYEAKRDEDIEKFRWESMRNDVKLFNEEFKNQGGMKVCSYGYDIVFAHHITTWIFEQYGFSLDELKKSTKDRSQIKWYEQVYKNNDSYIKSDICKNYSKLYSGEWVDREKTRVLNNVYEYKKRKRDLETKRHKEQDIGLKEIITVVVVFTSVAIACQTESVLPALIVSIIGTVYLCTKIPGAIKFFKERHEYINK